MSVRFDSQTQQVVNMEDDEQHLQSPYRVPLDRMTSRSDKINPYAQVQEQLTTVNDYSREERTERARVRRIFDKVRLTLLNINESFLKISDFSFNFSTMATVTGFWKSVS